MLQKLKGRLKDQKGFTLIELLAVIVILGILAAIAIPSIMGIINNSKKDAVAADAQQMVSSAKLAVAANEITWTTNSTTGVTTGQATLSDLITKGYMDEPKNPFDNSIFNETSSIVYITKNGDALSYNVSLMQTGTSKYYFGDASSGTSSDQLDRNHEQ